METGFVVDEVRSPWESELDQKVIGGAKVTLLIISVSICAILFFTGLFIVIAQVIGDEIVRRDAIDVAKNRKYMGL